MKASAVLGAGLFPLAVADRAVRLAPRRQAGIEGILVSIHLGAGVKGSPQQRLERLLLDVLQHTDDHLAAALKHPEDGRLLLLQGATPTGALQASPSSPPAFFKTAYGWPLYPATP